VSKNASYIHTLAKSTAVALGHSQASAITALKAITNGASRYIHLYNAMAPFSHRNPSILNAALLKNHAYVELITDGIHVDPLVLKTTYQTLSANSIIIVSDTLSCKGLKNGRYKLGDLDIIKHTNIATLASDNTIAGAVMPYNLQVANFYKATKCSLTDIVKMTSYNPIRAINMHQSVGQIAPNYWANFVVIDKKFNVLKTIIKGQEVYRK
jgi:N-acetylglucosamine-6-phosphate deacetylase